MKISGLTSFALSVTLALAAAPAQAADPVIAGQTEIGTHPSYPGYSAFWRTGFGPALLADSLGNTDILTKVNGVVSITDGGSAWMDVSASELDVHVPMTLSKPIISNSIAVGAGSSAANVGHHPTYSSIYAGFWLTCPNCGTVDYSLLTEGHNTFLNAPSSNGRIYFRGNNVDWGFIQSNAFQINVVDAYKPGGGAWSATSDRRVKRDIVDFHDGLAAIERVRPVTYRYNGLGETEASNRRFVGVVAQELEPVLPFMVSSQKRKLHKEDNAPTDIKQVDPSAFTYVLINAVKELAGENRQMKRVLCHDHPTEPFCTGTLAATP